MNLVKRTAIFVCVSLFLGGCATNKGDFGLEDIRTKPPEQKKPRFKDEETQPRTQEQLSQFMQPGLGVEIEIPVRNAHFKNEEQEVLLKPEKIAAAGDGLAIPHQAELQKIADAQGSYLLDSHNNFGESRKRANMQYVRSGYVAVATVRDNNFNEAKGPLRFAAGPKGYVYYKGVSPAQAFPVSGKAVYTGTWDFVTDAKKGRDKADFTVDNNRGPGDRFGATSFDDSVNNDKPAGSVHEGQPVYVGHSSEFEVDFANKSLTGELYKNHRIIGGQPQERTKRYRVDAKLSGNRFRGLVSAQNKADPYFGSDADLEGGFFGPEAQEMAGKFLAKDNSLFGVLAARRGNGGGKTEKAFDAYRIGTDDLALSEADNFGDARQLVFRGQVFPLLPAGILADKKFVETLNYDLQNGKSLSVSACCGNLDYLKFGSFWVGSGKDKDTSMLFLQGERTPSAQMPVTAGSVRYQGTWQAQIAAKSGQVWGGVAGNAPSGSRAVFDVDFGTKEVSGTLTADNRVFPTFNISARIDGNGFSGTAKTGPNGFVLDPQSQNPVSVHIGNAQVKGGFYGPNAAELGGIFHGGQPGEDRVGGSFGAKRQVANP